MTDPAKDDENEKAKVRLSYLMDMYKLYHGHINTMFNYFLILAGLIATAFVQSTQNSSDLHGTEVPTAIAIFGCVLCGIGWAIHLRSRALLDTLEKLLRIEEDKMFDKDGGYLTFNPKAWFFSRHKYQFQAIYLLFCLGFLAAAASLHLERLQAMTCHLVRWGC